MVAAGPVSYNGNHRGHPRLRNVSSDDFDISIEDWAYMDTLHIEEAIHCLAVEQGESTIEDGTALVAGQVTSNHERTSVSFPSSFSTTPVAFSDAQTYNHSRPVVTRQPKISESGFVVRLQGSERRSSHETEDIGYVAIEPGTGTANGRAFEVGVQSGIDHEWSTIEFDGTYTEPAFIADMQTVAGPDSSGLRYRNLTESSVDVRVEEEQSNDDEVVHVEEDVGYLVAGAVSSEATPSPSPEPSAPEGETGEGDGFGVDEYGVDRFGV